MIFGKGINTPAIKDYCQTAEEVTYLLKLIQRFNYLKGNNVNKMKHLMLKIQMCSFLNFLENKSAWFLFCLDSMNI